VYKAHKQQSSTHINFDNMLGAIWQFCVRREQTEKTKNTE